MYQRILLPLDGSKIGEAAIPVIDDLVTKLKPEPKVEIILLQVITSTTHWVIAGEASAPIQYTEKEMEMITKNSRDYLEKAGERLRNKGAIVKTVVKVGNAEEQIVKTVDETKADLIAMSTHGRSGLGRLAFGSVTDKILRIAPVPVLTVKASASSTN